MGKLRNADTDVGKFGQWLGRKCRNHNPLEELALSQRERDNMPGTYGKRSTVKKQEVVTVKGREDQVIYRAGGRNFMMTLTEVSDSDLENQELVPVGY